MCRRFDSAPDHSSPSPLPRLIVRRSNSLPPAKRSPDRRGPLLSSKSQHHPAAARVRCSLPQPGPRVDEYRVGVPLLLLLVHDVVATGAELLNERFKPGIVPFLQSQLVRQPLMVQSRARQTAEARSMSNSSTFTTTHSTVLMIVRPPGTAGHQHSLAVAGHDRRRLRAEHPLARRDQIGRGADVPLRRQCGRVSS